MSSFELAFSTVFPLLLLLTLGYFLKRVGLFTNDFLDRLNTVCFQVFLPTILFVNVYESDFTAALQPNLIVFALLSIVALFIALTLLVLPLVKRTDRRAVIVQGAFRSNYILLGLPISISLFGAEHTGTTAMLIAFVIPLFNILAVVAFEMFRGGRIRVKSLARGVIANPLVIAAILAWLLVLTGLRLPGVVESAVNSVAQVATPLALITLGGTFVFSRVRPNIRPLFATLLLKLIVVPVVFLPIAIALGYRGSELGALLALYASPTAVTSFTMAEHMGGDGELAGQIVTVGSMLSLATIFAAIVILENLGMLSVT